MPRVDSDPGDRTTRRTPVTRVARAMTGATVAVLVAACGSTVPAVQLGAPAAGAPAGGLAAPPSPTPGRGRPGRVAP